jgi:glycosyltransferase involved in cell wall biosynthesis
MKVSVLLLTFNEESNLPRCLRSLSWCDDVVTVDSGSRDGTLALAQAAGVRVLHRPFDNFANQRNYGLVEGQMKHEWVLHLDADEALTEEFIAQLTALEAGAGIDAYEVPSKTMLHNHWLRYAGMYPTYQVRLGHRDRLRFKQVGHGQREDLPASQVGTFAEPYLHYNFSQGIAAWLRKHIRYAEDEARLLVAIRQEARVSFKGLASAGSTGRRRFLKELSAFIPLILRPFMRFFYVYVWKRGFLDGRHGILYALMMSIYEGMISILAMDVILRKNFASPRPIADDRT